MKITPSGRRRAAVAASLAVAASTLLGVPSAQAAVPAATHGATVDYFDDVYTALGANSVFETVTIERFEYILKNVAGNVAFFIGDPAQVSSQATIGHINDVAKQQGITHIYNFTPKLDGKTLNVWDTSASGLRQLGRTYYETTGNRLISDYLGKDPQTPFTKNASTDPYLFVYNKDRVDGTDRIVSALAGPKAAADLDTAPEVDAYKTQVSDVLGAVAANQYVTTTNFEFQKAENNRRHTTTAAYSNATTHGGNILDDSDNADGFRIKTLTYPELEHLLQQPGEIPILFGGTWCHNTRAIIKFVNADAQKYGIKTVYNFDFSLFSAGNGGSNYDHIRANPDEALEDGVLKVARPSHLYGDLVNTYLTNAVAEYKKTGDPGTNNPSPAYYFPGGDTTKAKQEARRIQVGHLLTYNKDHKDALGNAAPVVDQAIRYNDDGSNTEHMTEWWYTSGAKLGYGEGPLNGAYNLSTDDGKNRLQNQRNFATEALGEIDTILGGLAGTSLTSSTSVSGLGGSDDVDPAVGATPTVTVSVAAAQYAKTVSLNTAGASAAPATAPGKPRGLVAVFDGTSQVGPAAQLKRDGTATITLPAQTAGAKSYTVRYLGRGDAIAASSTPLAFTVKGDLSTTTLTAPESLAFGAGGTVTATVADLGATGKVSLTGLPGGPVQADLANGSVSFAIPAKTVAGSYPLIATYLGDDKYGSSTDEGTVAITKGNASVTATSTGAAYGNAGSVAVAATGPAGYVPTGPVSVTLGGATYAATLDAQGRATVAVPATLEPKAYAVTVVITGDANVRAASTTSSLTVTKGSVKIAAGVVKKAPTSKKAGSYKVTVQAPSGLVKPTLGKVTVTLKKGSKSKKVTGTLKNGVVTVKVPKLAKGTWKVKIGYAGDGKYLKASGSGKAVKVKK